MNSTYLDISYKIRKRILCMAFLSILFVCLCYVYVPKQTVWAEKEVEEGDPIPDEGDVDQKTPDNIVHMFARNCTMVYDVCKASNLVNDTIQKFTMIGQIRHETRLKDVMHIAVTIAIGLAYIYILLYILREAMRGEMTMEFWGKCFIVLIITCIAASQWATLLDGLDRLGDATVKRILVGDENTTEPIMDKTTGEVLIRDESVRMMYYSSSSPVKMMVEQGVLNIPSDVFKDPDNDWAMAAREYWGIKDGTESLDSLKLGDTTKFKELLSDQHDTVVADSSYTQVNANNIVALIIFVLKLGMKCAIDAQIFFIGLQLALRGAVMPIAIVGVASDGLRGGAVRFLKRYFALYVQEAIIVIIMVAFTRILLVVIKPAAPGSNVFFSFIIEIYYVLTCYGAITAAITQSGAIAQEVLGD